mmetsp:Transcript_44363/g.143981  ORF Transcript_44363/g.143981 Transcript_44363/m.143981 type:complete len:312 (-) Transcript_44363:172-1107(-)
MVETRHGKRGGSAAIARGWQRAAGLVVQQTDGRLEQVGEADPLERVQPGERGLKRRLERVSAAACAAKHAKVLPEAASRRAAAESVRLRVVQREHGQRLRARPGSESLGEGGRPVPVEARPAVAAARVLGRAEDDFSGVLRQVGPHARPGVSRVRRVAVREEGEEMRPRRANKQAVEPAIDPHVRGAALAVGSAEHAAHARRRRRARRARGGGEVASPAGAGGSAAAVRVVERRMRVGGKVQLERLAARLDDVEEAKRRTWRRDSQRQRQRNAAGQPSSADRWTRAAREAEPARQPRRWRRRRREVPLVQS